ncbi:MAG: ABC transporter permease [Syntrophus sp. (in: bacteria)]|nr:ABC transporter permease [Syntrophus sp. (in: bacteria)]
MHQEHSDTAHFEEAAVQFIPVAPDRLILKFSGNWVAGGNLPDDDEALQDLVRTKPPPRIAFATEDLGSWDSGFLVFLARIVDLCNGSGTPVDLSGLPEGVRKLLDLASPDKQRTGVTREKSSPGFLVRVADATLDLFHGFQEMLAFIGDATLSFLKLLRGKAEFRRSDLSQALQETGAQALPIVSLISLLVGMILAFVAAIQLKLFGVQIYVADVVGIGVVRVMGAIMTGIIMAGRTGAAFAAQLGMMQVNEEIDALESLGIPPMDFLVLPRMLALMLMMPMLCIYSDLMGILGGMIVGVGMLDLGVAEYYYQTLKAVTLTYFWIGLFHSFVFGILVALAGCLRGLQCERNAAAVGFAATSAVVTGIVSIVVATAVITLLCQVLGI